jgi:flagellar hook-length control protein FliK
MIIQNKEANPQASLHDLLGGNTKKGGSDKSNDLFANLLQSFGTESFKTIIDPKRGVVKSAEAKPTPLKEELMHLLGGSEESEFALFSKELTQALSNDHLKTLIHDAKAYLQKEIIAKKPELEGKIDTLPKTIGGLIKLAEKLGLEPTSLTLSTITESSATKESFPAELLTKPLLETKAIAALPAPASETSPAEAITQLLSQLKHKEEKSGFSADSTKKGEGEEPQNLKTLLQTLDKKEPQNLSLSTAPKSSESQETAPAPAASPSHKAEALMALLQGETEIKEGKTTSAEGMKIEGDGGKSIHLPKADSIEVKAKEAQQSMRLFAGDLKEAVQEYKPPFTRLSMKLNPEKLGEVEVTLVQRGNNVHVNIQSNNANSIAFLAHNATELKAQLAHQGITNATMNFMSGGENPQHNGQQQHEQRQDAFRSYQSFEEFELNEEELSALEIIIPHYA